jgi:hypothetical protein
MLQCRSRTLRWLIICLRETLNANRLYQLSVARKLSEPLYLFCKVVSSTPRARKRPARRDASDPRAAPALPGRLRAAFAGQAPFSRESVRTHRLVRSRKVDSSMPSVKGIAAMKRPGRRLEIAAAMLAAVIAFGGPAAANDTLDVTVDQAMVVKLPDHVVTIVVGNPLIADVSLQAGGMLVVTGKGYGATNVLALDRAGAVLMDRSVRVHGPNNNVVVVYRGPLRETYSCQPNCEQRITLGDGAAYFNSTIAQTSARNLQAQATPPQSR